MQRYSSKPWVVMALSASLLACGEAESPQWGQTAQALGSSGLSVSFDDCTEFAGIGLVPASNARALVPDSYTLAGDESDAILVVRVVDCEEVSVQGRPARSATLAQVGVSVTERDESADINNYTLWAATTHGQLHGRLKSVGVDSDLDANLAYAFSPKCSTDGILAIDVSPPQSPDYEVNGTAVAPSSAPVPFVATWWAETAAGDVRMRTEFPEIRFGSASMTLTTALGSEMAELIGDTTMTFALLDSYNTFDHALLEVDVLEQ